jgi:phosphoribosylformylglycinamidine synthase
LKVERTDTLFTNEYEQGRVLRIPIAHGEGNFVANQETLDALEGEGRVVFRYVDSRGEATPEANPNGSRNNIAGILNDRGNVLGMMPHPERAMEPILGSSDGVEVFTSLLGSLSPAGTR